ncbi:uncharacterized protein EV420DRAFT_1480590 [Desarmillaria tabescens]|uniref:Uncharacterized protein n=1 Tax=Armillaria tabescens TaxID=1929756 RepID=A0AA39KAD3_ARMTA|nr:uncharacterized protein EV420DRAFT_1480590 [Desarmillaria tabescens]KAK0457521.1 hypothetical protein EV420DRAFT_1480590 [Desarmillaria tabescens]
MAHRFIYYKKYTSDMRLYRFSIRQNSCRAGIMMRFLDALHVAFSTHALYFYLVDMFGDLSGALVHSVWFAFVGGSNQRTLSKNGWHIQVQLGINVLIVICVQGYESYSYSEAAKVLYPSLYVIRLWKLGRLFHKFLPCAVFLVLTASLGNIIAFLASRCRNINGLCHMYHI